MNETNKFEAEDLNSISRVEFGIIYLHALSNIWDNATEIVLKSMATSLLQGLTSTVTFFAFKSIHRGLNALKINLCKILSTIYCTPTTPPTGLDNYTFETTCKIYVPLSAVSSYKYRESWSKYASQIEGYDFE